MYHRLAPAALLALAAMAACTPTSEVTPTPEPTPAASTTTSAQPTPTPSASTEAPSPSPSPTPTSTLSPEQEAAQAAAEEYFRALNAVRSDPNADFQQVADITTGEHTAAEANVLNDFRSKGVVQVGKRTYTYKGVGPVVEVEGIKSVEVRVCSDSTNSDMVDEAGNSVLDPQRSRFVDFQLDIVLVGDRWKVNGGQSEPVESC
ncbi:hypothetical protein [Tessaracoccus sp. MC1756]|uniref:hypothetical protein n=1 Tax=Tessaracoccus sp. MC1756 TaxID=2760311 RepID=UPI0015FF2AD9|nr:hypothetical protein [Tessaracoccus sp. MC1756]MBB1510968.1 hypothetical protein [Tessaracoccus sp. MC1756]